MNLQLDKFIVADDIREEKDTSKFIVIGLYPDDQIVVHQEFPYIHPSLAFLLSFDITGTTEDVCLKIINEDDKAIIETPYISGKEHGKKGRILTCIHNLIFDKPGTYKVVVKTKSDSGFTKEFLVKSGKTKTK